eukprot:4167828-Amphidinium_carterae.1
MVDVFADKGVSFWRHLQHAQILGGLGVQFQDAPERIELCSISAELMVVCFLRCRLFLLGARRVAHGLWKGGAGWKATLGGSQGVRPSSQPCGKAMRAT